MVNRFHVVPSSISNRQFLGGGAGFFGLELEAFGVQGVEFFNGGVRCGVKAARANPGNHAGERETFATLNVGFYCLPIFIQERNQFRRRARAGELEVADFLF